MTELTKHKQVDLQKEEAYLHSRLGDVKQGRSIGRKMLDDWASELTLVFSLVVLLHIAFGLNIVFRTLWTNPLWLIGLSIGLTGLNVTCLGFFYAINKGPFHQYLVTVEHEKPFMRSSFWAIFLGVATSTSSSFILLSPALLGTLSLIFLVWLPVITIHNFKTFTAVKHLQNTFENSSMIED